MRVGTIVSIVGHAAILGVGLVAFSSPKPLEAEKIDALPIELVSIGEETDLTQGEETSRILPEEKPQPKPELAAPVPAPKPQEQPAEKPVEATAQPPPPPPPPPEPVAEIPEPQPEESIEDLVASLPPEPEPDIPVAEPEPEPAPQEALAPAPRVIVNPNKPRPRPAPPQPVVQQPEPQPSPAPQPPQVAERAPDQFNADTISALLNKQEPAGGGDPQPAQAPQTLGTEDGRVDAAMTQSEIAALKARLYQCWNPPVAVREAGSLVVMVRINLNSDGSLASAPQIVGVDNVTNPLSQVAAESAVRAVQQCAPFGDILRPETYSLWNQIDFVFDPREMLGISSG